MKVQQPGCILLVEDNPDDELLTLRAFKKRGLAQEIIVARDGEMALALLLGEEPLDPLPHLVLLDLKIPKIDGLTVLRRIREAERTMYLPVVVLTTSDEQQDLVESYKWRCNSYIRKPVDFLQFSEAIGQMGNFWLDLNKTPKKW